MSEKYETEQTERRIVYYVIDEILQRVGSLRKSFSFIRGNKKLESSFLRLIVLKQNPPQDMEETQELHATIVRELEDMQKGTEIVTFGGRAGKKTLEIPKEIAKFEDIVMRVEKRERAEEIDNAVTSTTDLILDNEIEGGLNNVVLRYRMEVRDEVLGQLENLYEHYGENRYEKPAVVVAEEIGEEKIFELLNKTTEELIELVSTDGAPRAIVDVILDIRESIAAGDSIGAPTKDARINEANRILYKKLPTRPNAEINFAGWAEIEALLEELRLKSDMLESYIEDEGLPRATKERISMMEAEALRKMGFKPPDPNDGGGEKQPGTIEKRAEVVSLSDFKKAKRKKGPFSVSRDTVVRSGTKAREEKVES